MAKLTEFENPLTGKKANLFNFGEMWQLILGVIVIFFVVATGQNLAKKISAKVPAFDTSIDPLITQPAQTGFTQVTW